MKTIDLKGYHFRVLLETPKSRVPELTPIKRKLGADLVVQDKTQTNYLFLEYIPDAIIIEEN
jgi:hypothetical protein